MKSQKGAGNVLNITDLRLLSGAEAWCDAGDPDETHRGEYVLLYIVEGDVIIQSTTFSSLLNPGDLLVLSSGAERYELLPRQETTTAYHISFVAAKVAKAEREWVVQGVPPPFQEKKQILPVSMVCQRIEVLRRMWADPACDPIVLQIKWLELWKMIQSSDEGSDKRTIPLYDIVQHIDEHFDEEFHIEEMARMAGIEPTRFYRQFKKYTSVSPLQYILQKRIERAKKLLVSTDLSVRTVATAVGYRDPYYFSRIFKKNVGLSPQQYRDALCRTIAVLHPAMYENLMALGVPTKRLIPFWDSAQYKEPYKWLDAAGADLRWLQKAKPALIVGTEKSAPLLDHLMDIAPTKLLPFKPFSWRKHLLQLGTFLGIRIVADKWLTSYEKRVANVRANVTDQLGAETILAARKTGQTVRVFGMHRRKIGKFLYSDLQFNTPPDIEHFLFLDLQHISDLNDFQSNHILLLHDSPLSDDEVGALHSTVHLASLSPWLHYSAYGHGLAIQYVSRYFLANRDVRRTKRSIPKQRLRSGNPTAIFAH